MSELCRNCGILVTASHYINPEGWQYERWMHAPRTLTGREVMCRQPVGVSWYSLLLEEVLDVPAAL